MTRHRIAMTTEQEQHLQRIKDQFELMVDAKYRAGTKEHPGNLWDMTTLEILDEAIKENIDQFTYLMSIREKLLGTVATQSRQQWPRCQHCRGMLFVGMVHHCPSNFIESSPVGYR